MKTERRMKFGVIGLGSRGKDLTRFILLKMDDVEVVAVCDKYEDRAEEAADMVAAAYGKAKPYYTTDHLQLLAHDGIDAVLVASDWESHNEVAIDAMKVGIPVALEVGGAYSITSLWDLVQTQQTSGTPLMLMENCCFGKQELLATVLARHGILGDVLHCH